MENINKNYAVIDIGTLKVKFLIASPASSGELREVYFSNMLTCFGADLDENGGMILEQYLNATIKELKRCRELIDVYNVENVRVISTHALRRAKNKEEVVEVIRRHTGFEVENISQEQEAKLFFNAVMNGFRTDKEYAIADIGGGSVQILVGSKKGLQETYSMPTGTQHLHEIFTSNPHIADSFTTEEDIEKMRKYILEQLLPFHKTANLPLIYGSSNIINVMKEINLYLETHEDSSSHPYKTYAKFLDQFMKEMLPLNYREREKRFSLGQGYMWGIDKAFLNIVTLAQYFQSPYIIPSNANIAWGLVYEMIEE